MKLLHLIFILTVFPFLLLGCFDSQEKVVDAGVSTARHINDRDAFAQSIVIGGLEYVEGNCPVLITVSDGGNIGARARDACIEHVSRYLLDEVFKMTGYRPYYIYAHNGQVDHNQKTVQSAEYHSLIKGYLDTIKEKYKTGFYLDLHTHTDENDFIRTFDDGQKFKELLEEHSKTKAFVKDDCGYSIKTHDIAGVTSIQLDVGIKKFATKNHDLYFHVREVVRTIIDILKPEFDMYEKMDDKINVGVYFDNGSPGRMRDAIIGHCSMDQEIRVFDLNARQIRNGYLKYCDVLVMPGGEGSIQSKTLEEKGRRNIVNYVENGGGYYGICAGAYLGAEVEQGFEQFKYLELIPAVPDHHGHGWARGAAMMNLKTTVEGEKYFPKLDRFTCDYFQGPVLSIHGDVSKCKVLVQFAGSVDHKIPESKDFMPGMAAIVVGKRKEGTVVLCSPHPEETAGLYFLVPRMVRIAANKPQRDYKLINPNRYKNTFDYDDEWYKKLEVLCKKINDNNLLPHLRVEAFKELDACAPLRRVPHGLKGLYQERETQLRKVFLDALVRNYDYHILSDLKLNLALSTNKEIRADLLETINHLNSLKNENYKH